mgnify:CR=1 FL=1
MRRPKGVRQKLGQCDPAHFVFPDAQNKRVRSAKPSNLIQYLTATATRSDGRAVAFVERARHGDRDQPTTTPFAKGARNRDGFSA